MHRSKIFISASLLTLAMTSASLAQGLVPMDPIIPVAPQEPIVAPVQPVGIGAQMPNQPAGGWDTSPPTVGANDPAERMTNAGGEQYLQQITQQASQRLEGLVGASVSPETASELDKMIARKRSIQNLELMNEEAELGVSLWGKLYNNEHAKAWREQEAKERSDLKANEQQAAAARFTALTQQSELNAQANAPDAMPVVFEVINGTALLLVPGAGETYVSPGSVLPGGLKIVSVGGNGVVAERDGKRLALGFGTSVATPIPAPLQNEAIAIPR